MRFWTKRNYLQYLSKKKVNLLNIFYKLLMALMFIFLSVTNIQNIYS